MNLPLVWAANPPALCYSQAVFIQGRENQERNKMPSPSPSLAISFFLSCKLMLLELHKIGDILLINISKSFYVLLCDESLEPSFVKLSRCSQS